VREFEYPVASALLSLKKWSLAANPAIPEALRCGRLRCGRKSTLVHDARVELDPSHLLAFVLTIC